jgi:ubiquinone/menaquinone biosynthesis C-methylase UbiE
MRMDRKGGHRNLSNLEALYRERFDERDLRQKNNVWKIICEDFLQNFIESSDTVLDMGAGTCEFINNIRCAVKYAADINPNTESHADQGVIVLCPEDGELPQLQDSSVNVVFASNFFEHMPDRQCMLDMLATIRRILVAGGRLIVVQPNVKYLAMHYWDFFDHQIALSHKSMREALVTSGFEIEVLRARFLPYTFRSRFPKGRFFVRTYLKLPIIQRIFGRQMLIVARKH